MARFELKKFALVFVFTLLANAETETIFQLRFPSNPLGNRIFTFLSLEAIDIQAGGSLSGEEFCRSEVSKISILIDDITGVYTSFSPISLPDKVIFDFQLSPIKPPNTLFSFHFSRNLTTGITKHVNTPEQLKTILLQEWGIQSKCLAIAAGRIDFFLSPTGQLISVFTPINAIAKTVP